MAAKEQESERANALVEAKETEVVAAESHVNCLQDKYQHACAGVAADTAGTGQGQASGSEDMLSLPEQVCTWDTRARKLRVGSSNSP